MRNSLEILLLPELADWHRTQLVQFPRERSARWSASSRPREDDRCKTLFEGGQKRIAKHGAGMVKYRAVGGHTSSMEREVLAWRETIKAAEHILEANKRAIRSTVRPRLCKR